jgi:hypothetical protein
MACGRDCTYIAQLCADVSADETPCVLLCLQYYQTAEDLGLYGQDPTANTRKGVFVATGELQLL